MRESRAPTLRFAVAAVSAALALVAAAASLASETAKPAPSPHFLVATRAMPDPMFERSVILMLPSVEFPLVAGVILNKPSAVPIRNLFPKSTALRNKDETAFFGGPVDLNRPTMVLRSAQPMPRTVHIFDDVYATLDPDSTAEALKNPALTDYRVFLGRSQWLDVQLHAESLAGAWYNVPATSELIFSDPEKLWSTLVQRAELQEVNAHNDDAIVIPRAPTFALLRALGGLCVPDVYAQEPTLTPTPSLSSQNEPTPASSPGPASGVTGTDHSYMIPQSTDVNVGDAVVPVPGGGCVDKVYEALAHHAPVPVTERECASAMDETLRLQREQSQSSPPN